jgi:hypothetical protein
VDRVHWAVAKPSRAGATERSSWSVRPATETRTPRGFFSTAPPLAPVAHVRLPIESGAETRGTPTELVAGLKVHGSGSTEGSITSQPNWRYNCPSSARRRRPVSTLATIFAAAFSLLRELIPDAFANRPAAARGPGEFDTMLYFSLATLTTTGYGDIVPLNPFARSRQ